MVIMIIIKITKILMATIILIVIITVIIRHFQMPMHSRKQKFSCISTNELFNLKTNKQFFKLSTNG